MTANGRDDASLRALVASLKTAPKRTVLVTVNEETAYPLYGLMSDAGIAIPSDIGLASFGALKMAEYFRPRLTLVEPDHSEIARKSSEALFQMIAGDFPTKSPHLFPCRIAWRESTGEVLNP
jgi:LacI family transcriptional regulator